MPRARRVCACVIRRRRPIPRIEVFYDGLTVTEYLDRRWVVLRSR